jgi:hypothetical protein
MEKCNFDRFDNLFSAIRQIKQFVVKLSSAELTDYKLVFYNQEFQKWKLDLLWEYIWDDREFEEVDYILNRR